MLIRTQPRRNTLLVAASDAPLQFRRKAAYLCDGTGDEQVIQDAIDELYDGGNGVGEVVLSPGLFRPGAHPATERLSGTGTLYGLQEGLSQCELDVGSEANRAKFQVGDVVYLRGGDYAGNSLEYYGCHGWRYVSEVPSTGTHIVLDNFSYYTFASVNWVRPQYSIRLRPFISLQGHGPLSTILRHDTNANCLLMLTTTEGGYAVGAQRLRRLSIQGDYPNQAPPASWEHAGLATGMAFDVKLEDVEARYFLGTGIAATYPWGYQQNGCWVEDCNLGVQIDGHGFITNVKIAQHGRDYLGDDPYGCSIRMGYAVVTACEIHTDRAGKPAVIMHGHANRGGSVIGGFIKSTQSTAPCIRFSRYADKYCVAPIVEGVKFYPASDSAYICDLDPNLAYVDCLRLSGAVCVYRSELVDEYRKLPGAQVSLTGPYRSWAGGVRIENVPVYNATGSTIGSGNAVCYVSGASQKGQVRLPVQANDPAFAGVIPAYVADNYRGYAVTFGPTWCYVDADLGAVSIGDLLCIADESANASRWGALCKAASGDTAVAIAEEALSSGYDRIKVTVIPPRPVP